MDAPLGNVPRRVSPPRIDNRRTECHGRLTQSFHGSLRGIPLLALAAMLLCCVPSLTRGESWVPVGAPGGNVRSLVLDSRDAQRLYLGTADGLLYRSDDGGIRWHRLSPGFPRRGCSLDAIGVDAHGAVYVGYWEVHGSGGGVARSNDGGKSFTILKGVEGESVRALALAPSDPKTLAAGTLSGVFLSRDGGGSWSRITPKDHPDLRNVESLAFDPEDANVLYAGTWHLAWKTPDGGASWVPVHRGMIDDSDVMTLTVGHGRPQAIFATACTGIYRMTDGSEQWTKLRGIPYSARRTRAFAQGDDDPDLLLAGTTEGLWVSEDGGGDWWRMTPKDLVVNAVVTQPGGAILLGTEGAGVLRSTDRGRTWASCNTGFSERFVFKLLFDDAGGRLVVAVWGPPHYSGVFVSPGVSGPWTRLGEGLDGRQVLSLALDGATILAGTDDGLYARGPAARAWTRVSTGGRAETHPRVTDLLVTAHGCILAATPDGLLRSTDAGRTWIRSPLGSVDPIHALAVCPGDPNVVAAAAGPGLFRSRDGGATWVAASTELSGLTTHEITFLPNDDQVLLATTSGGLFRSDDQGATWRRVGGGLPRSDLMGLAARPDGRVLFVSDFSSGGIFRSADGGSTWERMPTDGLGSDHVWALGVDPAAPDVLLASSSAGGLHALMPHRHESRGRDVSSTEPADLTPEGGVVPTSASPSR